jgi:very-short-patch-repair endonuclease
MKHEMRELARRQEGLLATWQLRQLGHSRTGIAHHTAQLRQIHDGVFLTGDAPITERQRWWAATLTAPRTVLAHGSAGAAWGFHRHTGPTTILRPGSGGPRRHDGLLIRRSSLVRPDGRLRHATTLDHLPITTPERTLADLWRTLPTDRARRKLLREALRLRRTSTRSLREHLEQAPPRLRAATLRRLLERYERLALHRCRSDAEARAVELIADARLPLPRINTPIAGEEADLSWLDVHLIIEIDGDQFHQDKAEDARRSTIWTEAGWRVRRAPADLVFAQPRTFAERVRHHLAGP